MCSESAFVELREEVATLSARVGELETAVELDSAALARIEQSTEHLLARHEEIAQLARLMRDARGAWRLLDLLGKIAKPVLWVLATAVAIVTFAKTGDWGQK